MSPLATVVPFPVFALAAGLMIAGLGAQQSVPFVRPAAGSSVVLEREMRTEARVEGAEAQSSTRIHTLRVEVKGTDPQGNLVVEVEVMRVHGSLDHGGAQVIEFDSATSQRPDPESDEARGMALTPAQRSWQIMALAGESFRATVGDNGLVVDIPGAAHLVASSPASMGFGTTETLLKELASCAFFGAPPANAAAKSSWDLDLAADAVGRVALRRKWKFTVASADADRLAVTGTGSVERDDRVAEKGPAVATSNGESAGTRREARASTPVVDGTLSYEGHISRRDGFVLDATRVESVTLHARSSVGEQAMTRQRTVVTRRVGILAAPATAVPARSPGSVAEAQDEVQPVTEARLREAFAAAQAACGKVLGVKLDELPPLRLVGPAEIAEVVAAENLPIIRSRQPDEAKARAEAAAIGQGLAATVYAKYAWSTRTFLVVPKAWEGHARALGRPALTSDVALRAVMVHELCHAIDDRRFDFGKRMLDATTSDAAAAFNAVMEGHAQLVTRRVCTASGWQDGFTAFTEAIGALPATQGGGEGWKFQRRAEAAAMQAAYVDGENFATAVLAARPETGAGDMFATPPKDQETILNPRWYLDPKTRPAVLHDVEPAIDAFVAMYDDEEWTSSRSSPTGKQIATGLTMLPREDVDAIVASLRSARLVQLVPTAAPQSRAMMLCILEFDNAESARRWVRLSGVVSAHKNATMTEGALRITHAEETRLDGESLQGLLQEKTMVQGDVEFDMVTIDAHRGRLVVETILVGDPPPMAAHLKIVEDVFAAIRVAK